VTLQWTIGQKDVTSDATERFSHITAIDTYTVISDLTYSVGKSDYGQVLTCKAVNLAASSGVQSSITLNVTSMLPVYPVMVGESGHTEITCKWCC
jgi:aromatic ring-opening dioxygenase LigB subunit